VNDRPLFDARQYELPELGEPGGRTANLTRRKLALLAAGVHPITRLPLLDRVTQCRDCVHVHRRHLAKVYIKCALNPTRSEATDLRLWYPACVAFEAAGD
jgi:hypothetical protein